MSKAKLTFSFIKCVSEKIRRLDSYLLLSIYFYILSVSLVGLPSFLFSAYLDNASLFATFLLHIQYGFHLSLCLSAFQDTLSTTVADRPQYECFSFNTVQTNDPTYGCTVPGTNDSWKTRQYNLPLQMRVRMNGLLIRIYSPIDGIEAVLQRKVYRVNLRFVSPCTIVQFIQITNQMQQFFSLLS